MANDLSKLNPTNRFSNRVENYVKYRPSYPDAVIAFFREQFGLQLHHQVADIGSGTGIFAELLLKNGLRVNCVEPNDAMRLAAEEQLSHYEGFRSVKGQSEQTGLEAHTVDLITAAQAFHWMEPVATKEEFNRILKPGGHIALIWNIRLTNTPFLEAYEKLKNDFGTDYSTAGRDTPSVIAAFFAPARMQLSIFPYEQWLNFEALKGQLLSASYIPLPDHPRYKEMMQQLTQLFEAHHENRLIKMAYETKVYWNGAKE
jgi:ubiquinone/menaquinone biosynthesis C-methylase UbiE